MVARKERAVSQCPRLFLIEGSWRPGTEAFHPAAASPSTTRGPRMTCGGMEGTDSASVPHPLRKKLLNHYKIKKYDAVSDSIGHSSLLLRPVLVCARVTAIHKRVVVVTGSR
uniref:Uncharacterized protein n=1 Tax=Oryza sativa subsp. japonica TaxID=39947 RepID=Q2QSM2_ORYSJ|nr:hypothetical protein LOC_Os12g23620 [Oryza sativa Japonica Group]